MLSAQAAGYFEAQQRAQAVAEKSEWPVEIWSQSLRHNSTERQEAGNFGFGKAEPSPRQLNQAGFHYRGQISRPGVKRLSASSGVMKAEKAQSRVGIRFWEERPFVGI